MTPRTIDGLEKNYEIKVEEVVGGDGTDTVPLEREGGVDHITVRLNDEEDVRFCLDTGASMILISGELASRLQLMRTGKTKHCTDANGETNQHQEGLIGSLQLGKFLIKNVRCTIHDRPGPGFGPLLGQAVLRLFDYSYSQADSSIKLSYIGRE